MKSELLFLLILFNTTNCQFVKMVPYDLEAKYHKFRNLTNYVTKEKLKVNDTIDIGLLQGHFIFMKEESIALDLRYRIKVAPFVQGTQKSYFCKKDNYCLLMTGKVNKSEGMVITIDSNNENTSFIIIMKMENTLPIDVSGLFYINTTSSSGTLLSNFLEIRDEEYWISKIIPKEPAIEYFNEPIKSETLPISFNCLDKLSSNFIPPSAAWVLSDLSLTIDWYWCSIKIYPYDLCIYHKYGNSDDTSNNGIGIKDLGNIKASVHPSGKLTIIDSNGLKRNDSAQGYFLACSLVHRSTGRKILKYVSGKKHNNRFSSIKWDFITLSSSFEHFTKNESVILTYGKKGFMLEAIYRVPALHYSYEWYYKNDLFSHRGYWNVTKFSLRYNTYITFNLAGLYKLHIRWDHKKSYEFLFHVKVMSPPILSEAIPKIDGGEIYLHRGSNYSVKYIFRSNLDTIYFYINGMKFDPYNDNKELFISKLSKRYKYLYNLKFDYNIHHTFNTSSFQYDLTQIEYDDLSNLSEDHTLTVVAENRYGFCRTNLNIIVFKPPKFSYVPMDSNCSEYPCMGVKNLLILCHFDEKFYRDRSIQYERVFFIGSKRLDKMKFFDIYFRIVSKGLVIRSLESEDNIRDNKIRKRLRYNSILCQVRMFNSNGKQKEVIYDSDNDTSVEDRMSTYIRWPAEISAKYSIRNASYAWIVFLTIGAIIMAMMVYLLVKFSFYERPMNAAQEKKASMVQKENNVYEVLADGVAVTNRSYSISTGSQVNMLPLVTVHYQLGKAPVAPTLCTECINLGSNNVNLSYSNKISLDNHSFRSLECYSDFGEGCSIDSTKFNEDGSFIGIYSQNLDCASVEENVSRSYRY